ncbi:MAG: 4-hydroxy-tetrahydrodipicolinate synthase [Fimbriimonadaceae bacterium]|nr:4-hydroxy-tetrahydrodipicolinate synthase [Fimbriimonadaceae bacterium]QOJ12432.1 MAG: 4-hydroxy-tetrahydrodipicolinate synthase [Chthonomonadaceae bacterium]
MGTFESSRDWGRLLTALVTPFDDDGNVDFAEARRIAAYVVDEQKNSGLVVSGTTGESPTLSTDEKRGLLSEILDEVGGRAAVLFGAGTYNTEESIRLARMGEDLGAHGLMLVNPYYNKPGQRGLEAHFRAIAESTSLQILLYNIQPRSAINLETETLLRLAETPNIVAVKEASGNLGQISDVCARVPSGFRVYSGDDGLTLPILSVGGYGVVSVAGHIVGDRIARMIESFLQGRVAESARLHQELLPLINALFAAPSPTPVKLALALLGFRTRRVRLPLVPLSESEAEGVERAFHALRSASPV